MGKIKKEFALNSKNSKGEQKTMRVADYLGDGLGQLPLNIMGSLVGQLTYFYTEKVGLAAGMVATLLLVVKILDAFSDLVMGKLMDHVNSPQGKCRPWFKWMALPAAISIVLLFLIPSNMGSGLQIAYILLTNTLITAVVYTAVAIPYGALMAVRTDNIQERGKMGIFRAAFGYVAGMVIAILLIPLTNALGGTQAAWIKISFVFAIISFLSLLVLYKVSKEKKVVQEAALMQPKAEEEDNVPFREGIKLLFQNKYWVIMLFAQLFMYVSYALSTSGGTYYCKYILGNDNIVALLGLVGLIPTILGFALVAPMTSKFGMTKTCQISCVIGAVACFVRIFTPYSLVTCLIGGAVTTFANIPLMCLFGAMVNNCVEYNEWKYGKKLLGMTNSANSFGGKIGSGIGGSLIGWLLALAGYKAALEVQPASVNTAIFAFAIYIPFALFVIMFLLLMKNDLEKKYPQIIAELQKRKMSNR